MNFEIYIIILLSYFIGAIPTGYLVVRWFSGGDIRKMGSGNVGAMNAFETTNNKMAGILTFVFDALKAILAVYLAKYLSNSDYYSISFAIIFVVLGHNYNVFLGWRGGRGLAPAAGTMLAVNPLGLILWCIMWMAGYHSIKKDVHYANSIASLGSPVMLYYTPDLAIEAMSIIKPESVAEYKIVFALLCFVIILRHITPLLEKVNAEKQENNEE